MKKALFTLAILPLILGVASCNRDNHKVNLLFGRETVTMLEDLSYADLANKIQDEENFILAVTPTGNCTCWNTFRGIILRYAQANKLIIYTIHNELLRDAKDESKSTFGIDYRSDRETFLIFEDGKIKEQRVYDSKDSIFKQDTSFTTYIEGQINLPNYYYLSLAELNTKYSGTEKFNIYFSRSNCPDCGYVEKHALKEYATKNPDFRDMYILDCEKIGIREYDEEGRLTPESAEAWQTFKDNYGLSNKYNLTYGYDTGFVPTFFSVTPTENGSKVESITSGSVYFNDTISKENDKYVVTSSYYTSERLINLGYASKVEKNVLKGLEIPEDDLNIYGGVYFAWKQEKAAIYHDALLFAYLDSLNF